MKKVFVAAAIVLGTISFSACDSKPAADAVVEAVDSAATETVGAVDSAVDATAAAVDTTVQKIDSAVSH